MNGQDSHQLLTNRNYLDAVYAFESMTGMSVHADLKGKLDLSEITAKFEDKMVGHMWLELALLGTEDLSLVDQHFLEHLEPVCNTTFYRRLYDQSGPCYFLF